MNKKFIIKGMSCSACSIGIEKKVNMLDGVKIATVSLMDESMVAEYDENIISDKQIIDTVNGLGYQAFLPSEYKEENKKTVDKVLIRFLVSLGLLLPLMYLSMGGMINAPLPISLVNYIFQFIITLAILIINKKFFIKGTKALISKSPDMDTLVALSSGASFIYSLIATIVFLTGEHFHGHLFYESSAMVVTLVTLGKWLEDKSKRKTSKEIEKLSKIVPKTVTILKDGKETDIDTNMVTINDLVVMKAGDYVAIDGKIKEGNCFVDKSAITGESIPIECKKGDKVVSGSIVKSGYIVVNAEKVGEDTLFSKIIEAVKSSGASKAPVQKFADKVAGIFVPVVSAISVITFIIWILVSKDIYKSFNFAISVLVISCPCALGLATPVAIMASTGKAASLGILFKDAETIEKTQNINCVLLDKTATITKGEPKVVDSMYFDDENLIKSISYAIESKSNHPLSICVKNYVGESNDLCEKYEYIAGKGSIATINGNEYSLGNKSFAEKIDYKKACEIQKKYDSLGNTTVFLSNNNKILAVFAIADTIKEDSIEAIKALNNHNIETVMVTGDNRGVAKVIADKAYIKEYVYEVLPIDKANIVKEYQDKNNYVAMVGDGINDSPAIKTADVGIAVGTGTDIAIESSDIVIVSGNLKGILDSILLSKKANKIIKGNLFWAFFYNVIALPVAAGVFAFCNIILTPSIAALCMCLSSLFVVTNALRIRKFKSYFSKNERKQDKNLQKEKGDNNMKTIYVNGMMCNHCVKHVKDALLKIDGIVDADVNLETKKVDITLSKNVDDKIIKDAIIEAGYEVQE